MRWEQAAAVVLKKRGRWGWKKSVGGENRTKMLIKENNGRIPPLH